LRINHGGDAFLHKEWASKKMPEFGTETLVTSIGKM
jgi:hypothetical protein